MHYYLYFYYVFIAYFYEFSYFWMGQGRDDMRKNSKRMVYGWRNFLVFTVLHERNYHV